jgi:hypothetical protein
VGPAAGCSEKSGGEHFDANVTQGLPYSTVQQEFHLVVTSGKCDVGTGYNAGDKRKQKRVPKVRIFDVTGAVLLRDWSQRRKAW